ncbi:MAG: family 10 glycosylhydrolase [Bacteroidetes bacterium]|nr:family 10 glycosylhydrolase [Bacteroidota bacterium]
MKKQLILIILLLTIPIISFAQSNNLKHEFRGAWVATVANIDWPSDFTLSTGQQTIELVQMFDSLQSAGINAVFFQIRTECDALYKSQYEPWSYWLTGKQGKAPEPYYDPLQLAISEAHSRNIELHAWFNPYRAVKKIGAYDPAPNHISVTHPEWLLTFKDYKMLDPGNPDAREFILNVMTDVLLNYDVDGIHFDDYFYPYGPKISNEDSLTFIKYNRGIKDIDEWRRDNINQLMREIYGVINTNKPFVKFGISPFGIVKNEYAGTNGFNSYDVLYCDPLTWLNEKIVDYILPQLYWEIDHELAPYKKLLPWWASLTKGRHLYIGHFSSRMADKKYKGDKAELGNQIKMNRTTENVQGSVFFSAKSIVKNWSGFADTLHTDYYKFTALPPKMDWKDTIPPLPPVDLKIDKNGNDVILDWRTPGPAADGNYPVNYIVYRFVYGEKINLNDASKIIHRTTAGESIFIENKEKLSTSEYIYVVTSIDRLGNESEGVITKFNN